MTVETTPAFFEKSVIYQISLRPFTLDGTLKSAEKLLPHIASTGADVVYLCPFVEADGDRRTEFWSDRQRLSRLNNPRSLYRLSDYYRIDPEYGDTEDLKSFMDAAHALGLRVIFDLVYYHCGPTARFIDLHPDFVRRDENGKVKIGRWRFPELNFDSPELRNHLWENMEYFIREFKADGYRCDVSGAVPLDFWEEGRRRMEALKPDVIMIAESVEDPAADQRRAFDANYSFSFSHMLHHIVKGEKEAGELRTAWCEQFDSAHPGLLYLRGFDNHDIANDDYDNRPEKDGVSPLAEAALAVIFTLDGTPFLYNGQEIGDGRRHSIFGGGILGVDWALGLTPEGEKRKKRVAELVALRRSHPALTRGELAWVDNSAPQSILSYRRTLPAENVFIAVNLSREEVAATFDSSSPVKEHHFQPGEVVIRVF